jgi:small-conductance mechanosensitive channel|tara:strand:+ start:391 stop:1242 length:852 start_codon:yes stop_codon:yes gene_type:complete
MFDKYIHQVAIFFNSDTGYVLLFIIIISLTFFIARLFKRIFKRNIMNAVLNSNDPTNYLFFQHIITASIYIAGFSAAMYMIPSLRTLSASLLAGAGIFAVAIGFASQKAFSNIISGLFIVIFKPFRIHDKLTIGTDVSGVVEDITLRHTIVRSYENKRFVIPNSLISEQTLVNSDITDTQIRKFLFYKVDYQTNLTTAITLIKELAENHPLAMDVRKPAEIEKGEEKVPVNVTEWGDYALIIRAAIWANDSADAFTIQCDLNESVKAKFDEVGIKIPTGIKLK